MIGAPAKAVALRGFARARFVSCVRLGRSGVLRMPTFDARGKTNGDLDVSAAFHSRGARRSRC